MDRKKSEEDYLRVIYLLDNGKGIRGIDIAKELEISKPSVSEMIKKIAKKNLIKIADKKIFLTRKGKILGENFFDKHYSIKNFLKKFFSYEEEKAKEEAHNLEHAFSDDSIKIISKLLDEGYGRELRLMPRYIG